MEKGHRSCKQPLTTNSATYRHMTSAHLLCGQCCALSHGWGGVRQGKTRLLPQEGSQSCFRDWYKDAPSAANCDPEPSVGPRERASSGSWCTKPSQSRDSQPSCPGRLQAYPRNPLMFTSKYRTEAVILSVDPDMGKVGKTPVQQSRSRHLRWRGLG